MFALCGVSSRWRVGGKYIYNANCHPFVLLWLLISLQTTRCKATFLCTIWFVCASSLLWSNYNIGQPISASEDCLKCWHVQHFPFHLYQRHQSMLRAQSKSASGCSLSWNILWDDLFECYHSMYFDHLLRLSIWSTKSHCVPFLSFLFLLPLLARDLRARSISLSAYASQCVLHGEGSERGVPEESDGLCSWPTGPRWLCPATALTRRCTWTASAILSFFPPSRLSSSLFRVAGFNDSKGG